ncbi:MAG: hypothetical protein ACQKBW_05490 [Puniceicoccales bacterium]
MPIRNTLSLVATLAWFIPTVAVFAQKVDWSNAPMNPIPVKYKAEHFNLKGPVFSADKRVFDEDGLLIKESSYVYYEDGLPTGKGSVIWETDVDGNVTHESYSSGRDTDYIYSDGRLVKETTKYKEKESEKTYDYDNAGRLSRVDSHDGDKTETTTYTYTVDGDSVHVTETIQRGTTPAKRNFLTYKDGHLTASRTEGDSIELKIEYEFDQYGNPVKWVHTQNNGVRDEFSARYQYYPDLKQRNQLTYGAVRKDSVTPVSVFRNGQIAEDVVFGARSDKSDILVYDDFEKSYYLVPTGSDLKPGQRLPVTELIMKGTDTIAFLNGSNIEPYYAGRSVFKGSKNKAIMTANGGILTYSVNQTFFNKYSLYFDMEPGQKVLPGRLLETSRRLHGRHLFYVVGDKGELELFRFGERIENPIGLKKGKVNDTDLLLYNNSGDPYAFDYVLPNALSKPAPGIYPARYFNSEKESVEPLPDDFQLDLQPPAAASVGTHETVPGYSDQDVAALYTFTPEEKSSYVRPYVNLTDAPLNPLPYVGSLYDLNWDGDIAYLHHNDQGMYFDEDGTRYDPTRSYFTDEETALREKGTYQLFDNGRKLLLQKPSIGTVWDVDAIYKYNPDGTVQRWYFIMDGQLIEVCTLEYDNDRRLVKSLRQRGKKNITITHSYEEVDGQLHVLTKVLGLGDEITRRSVFGNGRLVSEIEDQGSSHSEKTYQYMNDDYGNPYVSLDQDGKEIEKRHYYHSDTWQMDRWHWLNEKDYGAYRPYVYAYDRRAGPIYVNSGDDSPFAHGVFYEPVGQNYMIAENALLPETVKNPDARGKMQVKVSAPAMLYLTKSGQFRLYDYGDILGGLKQFMRGNTLILFDAKRGHTYMVQGFQTGEDKFYPAEDLGTDVAVWFQSPANNGFSFFVNGGSPDGKLTPGGAYPNGDALILKDGQPWGILEANDLKRPGNIHRMLPYDNRGRPGQTPPPPVNPQEVIQQYAYGVPITLKREAGKYRFYQKGKQIFEPKAFVVGDSGNAFAFYGSTSYHLFKQAKGLRDGESLLEEQRVIDPILVENNGSETRVWLKGEPVPEDGYSLFSCDNGNRFLYVQKGAEACVLKTEGSYLNYQNAGRVGNPDVLIKNKNDFIYVVRGVAQPTEEVTLYPHKGEIIIYIESDPTHVISDIGSLDELTPGIYSLRHFTY